MALTQTDKSSLSQEQQSAIQGYTDQYNAAKAAGDAAAMEAAHQAAEQVRASQGYSGGANGATVKQTGSPARSGGYAITPTKTADQLTQDMNDYMAKNYSPNAGFVNGYSGVVNGRSQANAIRRQMLENTQNWNRTSDQATRDYLHQQNVALNKLLSDQLGGTVSEYDEKTGTWYTNNANNGYGKVTYDKNMEKTLYGGSGGARNGYTDADFEKLYGNLSNRYNNFVDYTQVIDANTPREGFTGKYANAAYGPNANLMTGARQYGDAGTSLSGQGGMADNGSGFLSSIQNGQIVPGSGVNAQNRYGHTGLVDGVNAQGIAAYSGKSGASGADGAGVSGSGGLGSGASGMEDALSQWRGAAAQQATNSIDYATNQSVKDLLRTQEDADAKYQTERNQVSADEQRALDNSALYSELRGDRGGIGQAQYNDIQNTAATNRLTVNSEQTKLATDTQRQITDLRAQGEYDKADKVLSISQTYLQQLISLEQWAAEYNLSAAQFQESVREWENEFQLSVSQVTGSYNGTPTLAAQKYSDAALSSSGEALLETGILPSAAQLRAMGLTSAQASAMLAANQASGSASRAASSRQTSASEPDYEGLYAAAFASPNAKNYIASNYKQYGFTKSAGLADGYDGWRNTPVSGGQGAIYKVDYGALVKYAGQVVKNGGTEYARGALRKQGYSDAVIGRVFASLGL